MVSQPMIEGPAAREISDYRAPNVPDGQHADGAGDDNTLALPSF